MCVCLWCECSTTLPGVCVRVCACACVCVGLARTINIRCTYGNFGRDITKYTVIYGVYIRFWPNLCVYVCVCARAYVYVPMFSGACLCVAVAAPAGLERVCMCMSMCVCICMCLSVCLYVYVCVCICVSEEADAAGCTGSPLTLNIWYGTHTFAPYHSDRAC